MNILYILGRQPAIGLAELESLYGASRLRSAGGHAIVEAAKPINFLRIGGAVKAAEVIETIDSTDINRINKVIEKSLLSRLDSLKEGKLKLGLSFYGFSLESRRINALGLGLKKSIRNKGQSVRLVPNNEPALNSAQVFHNKLTAEMGWEVIVLKDRAQTIIALTTDVQNIDSYTLRDRGRPKRDARVGMLPPKLAQTIINMAAASPDANKKTTILDPFCGTGVILLEANVMGYSAYGTDLEERMVDYSKQNLEWLAKLEHNVDAPDYILEQGDATDHKWKKFDVVAGETYLGRPFTSPPSDDLLQKNRSDCDTIIRKFLRNIYSQAKSGDRFCLAVPAWFANNQIYHLRTLDSLEEIGYNRISFVHADEKDLIYHREDQIVGRELVVITRK